MYSRWRQQHVQGACGGAEAGARGKEKAQEARLERGMGLGTVACCILSAEEAPEGLENRARLQTEVRNEGSGL